MADKLRINFVLPPITAVAGGPLAILEYANRLSERGHRVSITTYPDSAWAGSNPFACFNECFKLKFEIRYVRDRGTGWPSLVNATVDSTPSILHPQPLKWILSEPYVWLKTMEAMPECDLNIATFWCTAFPVYLSKKGKPVYFMQHYEEVFYGLDADQVLQKLATRMSYGLPMYKVANSSWLARMIKDRYGQEVPFSTNAIEISDFAPKPKLSERDGIIRIVTYAHWLPWKGFADAVSAMAALKRKYGNRIEWNVFGQHHSELPPHNPYAPYRHHPKLSFGDLAELYATSDIALCPSWYESFPLPPLEAMACQTAVVTTRLGTEEYAFDNRNALVVGARDVDGMTNALLRLVDDRDLRERLAAAGRRTAQGFTWDIAVEKREEILYAIHRGEVDYDVNRGAKLNLCDGQGEEFESAPRGVAAKPASLYWDQGKLCLYDHGVRRAVTDANLVPDLIDMGIGYTEPNLMDVARIPWGSPISSISEAW